MANSDEPLLEAFAGVSYEAWRGEVERALKGGDFDKKLVTRTLEGIDVQPLYVDSTMVPAPALRGGAWSWPAGEDAAGLPGAPPYRRGALASGRYGARWDMRARYDDPSAAQLAGEIAADLGRGARSLWLCFDAQVRGGRASAEPPQAVHERGVPCVSAQQLAALLANVPLDRVLVSLDAGANALAVAACFAQVARARGLALEQLEAWFNADPLAALARDGSLPFTLESARTQVIELARWATAHAPRARSVTVSTLPYHDAGAHAAQEIGIALASGVTYLRWLVDGGVSLRDACSQIAFSVAVGSDLYMEIAKLRALRQCWANAIAACGGAEEEQRSVVHAATSLRTKTQRDPWVNLLRETTEAFAAAVGGADALTTSGFDRLAGVSDAFARRIAGNAQVILDEEAHVTRVADPGGGSWYIESLTDQLAQRAWQMFQRIETAGGMLEALRSGRIASEIAEVARERDAAIAKRKQAITGVSEYANVDEAAVTRPEPDWAAVSRARAAALQAASKDEAVAKPLLQARNAGRDVMDAAIGVAAAGATLGQLSCALAGPGEPERIAPLPQHRNAAAFERLRDACDAAARARGTRPSVFLANLGPIPQHKARAQFTAGFFNAGGLVVHDNDGFGSAEAAAEAFARSGAQLCAICGSDDAYPQFVETLAPLLAARGAKRIVLAGRPGDAEARYRAAGVSDFIFMGCNVLQTLEQLLAAIGVGVEP